MYSLSWSAAFAGLAPAVIAVAVVAGAAITIAALATICWYADREYDERV